MHEVTTNPSFHEAVRVQSQRRRLQRVQTGLVALTASGLQRRGLW